MTTIRPHEKGMTVQINVPGDDHDGAEGIIDEFAIYSTVAHGLDFTGWDMLVAFHNGPSHAYAAYNFDDVEIVRTETVRLTADVVLFSERGGVNYILLIRRGWDPYEGHWALPGGHVDLSENTLAAARRELAEETGLTVENLDYSDAYATVGRDPRGRYVTFAYTARVNGLPAPTAGDDAAEAQWIPLSEALKDGFPLTFDHREIISDARDLMF